MIRVSTLSKELGTTNKVLVGFLAEKYPEFGITDYKTHHGKTISDLYEEEVREKFAKYLEEELGLASECDDGESHSKKKATAATPAPVAKPAPVPPTPKPAAPAVKVAPVPPPIPTKPKVTPRKKLSLRAPIVVRDLATALNISPFKINSELMSMRIFVSSDQNIEDEVAVKIADNHGVELEVKHHEKGDTQQVDKPEPTKSVSAAPIPPIEKKRGVKVPHNETSRKCKMFNESTGATPINDAAQNRNDPLDEFMQAVSPVSRVYIDTCSLVKFAKKGEETPIRYATALKESGKSFWTVFAVPEELQKKKNIANSEREKQDCQRGYKLFKELHDQDLIKLKEDVEHWSYADPAFEKIAKACNENERVAFVTNDRKLFGKLYDVKKRNNAILLFHVNTKTNSIEESFACDE